MTTWEYFRFLYRLERGRRNRVAAFFLAAWLAVQPTKF